MDPSGARKPQKWWLEVVDIEPGFFCESIDFPGITAIGADKNEVLTNFRKAIAYHLKHEPSYQLPSQPSPKIKCKDHNAAVAAEIKKHHGEDEVLKTELALFRF